MNKDLTDRIAVLLINLGTPEKPYKDEVREYLKEFLSDPDVIDTNRFLRWAIVNLIGCEAGEKVQAFVSAKEFNDFDYIVKLLFVRFVGFKEKTG